MAIEGSYQGFDVAVADGIAVLTFSHPERLNAISAGTRRELAQVVTQAQFDDDVRVLVFTGTGRGFVAGVGSPQGGSWNTEQPTTVPPLYSDSPPGELDGERAAGPTFRGEPISRYDILTHISQGGPRAIRRLDKLTVAAVNGYAIQWGLSLALACDFVIVARSAQLASATLRTAFLPDEGGHWLLVQHLGVRRALELMILNRFLSADEAAALGLVNEVVDDDQLMARTMELAAELAAGPQVAMRMLKKATYLAAELTFDQAGEDIAVRTAITDFHEDVEAGTKAFRARPRETPTFNAWLER